jgi:hypothetical protein
LVLLQNSTPSNKDRDTITRLNRRIKALEGLNSQGNDELAEARGFITQLEDTVGRQATALVVASDKDIMRKELIAALKARIVEVAHAPKGGATKRSFSTAEQSAGTLAGSSSSSSSSSTVTTIGGVAKRPKKPVPEDTADPQGPASSSAPGTIPSDVPAEYDDAQDEQLYEAQEDDGVE